MRQNAKGFTLMELMVVIVIVAILAAVAVPLYINYVKDAQRTEAKGAIGAIISGEQVFFQKNNGIQYAASLQELEDSHSVDVTEAKVNWTFTIENADPNGFTVRAVGVTGKPSEGLTVIYTFGRTTGGTWTET